MLGMPNVTRRYGNKFISVSIKIIFRTLDIPFPVVATAIGMYLSYYTMQSTKLTDLALVSLLHSFLQCVFIADQFVEFGNCIRPRERI